MSKDHKPRLKQDRPVLPKKEFSKSLAALGLAAVCQGCLVVSGSDGITRDASAALALWLEAKGNAKD